MMISIVLTTRVHPGTRYYYHRDRCEVRSKRFNSIYYCYYYFSFHDSRAISSRGVSGSNGHRVLDIFYLRSYTTELFRKSSKHLLVHVVQYI